MQEKIVCAKIFWLVIVIIFIDSNACNHHVSVRWTKASEVTRYVAITFGHDDRAVNT